MKTAHRILTLAFALGLPLAAAAQDRMPAIPSEQMTDAQKKSAEEIIKGPRGALNGPFIPLLRSPELLDRAQRVGEYLRFRNSIGPRLGELVTLIVARRWTQQYEWHVHEPAALKAGIKPEIVKAIAEGRRPDGMAEDEAMVYDFCAELHANSSVSDATYNRALSRLGEQGVIDMVGLDGYYTFLAMIMNTTRTAVPAGGPEPLPVFAK